MSRQNGLNLTWLSVIAFSEKCDALIASLTDDDASGSSLSQKVSGPGPLSRYLLRAPPPGPVRFETGAPTFRSKMFNSKQYSTKIVLSTAFVADVQTNPDADNRDFRHL